MSSGFVHIQDGSAVVFVSQTAAGIRYANPDKWGGSVDATESNRNQTYIGVDGTILKWFFFISNNTTTGTIDTILRVNGADVTGSSITIGSGATGSFQISNIGFAVSDSDNVTVELDATGTTGTNFQCTLVGVYISTPEFPGEEVVRVGDSHSTAQSVSASTTRYGILNDLSSTVDATEANVQRYYGINGAARRLFIHVASNATTGDSTISLRQGGSSIATITVGAGATGYFKGDVNVSIADNDLLDVQIVAAAGGAITLDCWGMIATISNAT